MNIEQEGKEGGEKEGGGEIEKQLTGKEGEKINEGVLVE